MKKLVMKKKSFKNPKNSKGELNISFGVIFSVIAGAFIIILAIIIATKLRGIELSAQEGETGKSIGILMNPLESSFESSKRIALIMPKKTRIYTSCETDSEFGRQTLQTSQLTHDKWTETDLNIKFRNKYLFSENPIEGKKFYVFSKPFEFPFKVSDLIYMTSSEDTYCFRDAPNEVEEDLELLQQPNLLIEDCPGDSINVCFLNKPDCDIKINREIPPFYVSKQNEKVYFEGDALMYAAIFSDKEEYECQIQRLMSRLEVLNDIYIEKNNQMVEELGCGTGTLSNLIVFGSLVRAVKNSEDLYLLKNIKESLERENKYGGCAVW